MPDGRVRLPANEFRSLSPARVHAAAVAGRALGWRWLPVGLLALGIALRVLAIVRIPVASDAAEYAVLGRSLLEGRGMWLPWGEDWDLAVWAPGPSHHRRPRGGPPPARRVLPRDRVLIRAGQGALVHRSPRARPGPDRDDGHGVRGEPRDPALRRHGRSDPDDE